MAKSVTLKDVANEAGVSFGTVSYVVNNDPRISSETANKVLDAIERLGYEHKGASARHIARNGSNEKRRRRTNRFAMISIGTYNSVLRAPVYAEAMAGVEEGFRDNGKAMIYHHFMNCRELTQLKSLVGKIDGLVIFPNSWDEELRRALKDFKCVGLMGLGNDSLWCDHVTADNYRVGELAAECMIGENALNCAFIGHLMPKDVCSERGRGFKDALEKTGGKIIAYEEDPLVVDERHHYADRDKMIKIIDDILHKKPKIEGIFFPGDILTSAAYPILYERGVTPGRDIQIVSCNNEKPLVGNLHPAPFIIDIHAYDIGIRAAELLMKRAENPNMPIERIKLTPEIMTRSENI